jgi:hypothetical protein
MRFLSRPEVLAKFEGKSVAIVGSGPGVLDNKAGFIDSHDIVVRINNFKNSSPTGERTDVFYSFFGTSIRKSKDELIGAGVKLCICKCPNGQPITSDWHISHGKTLGIDFRYIYKRRATWWFCDTYIPTKDEFLEKFKLLNHHVPTTGFSCIQDILSFKPADVYLTGFDFFRSGLHNVDEYWRPGDPRDPIGHVPERELQWLDENIDKYPIRVDPRLGREIRSVSGKKVA